MEIRPQQAVETSRSSTHPTAGASSRAFDQAPFSRLSGAQGTSRENAWVGENRNTNRFKALPAHHLARRRNLPSLIGRRTPSAGQPF